MKAVLLKVAHGLVLALMVSVILVSLFQVVQPYLDSHIEDDRAVMQTFSPIELKETLIVPFLKQIPLVFQYKKVRIMDSEAYIDLMWSENHLAVDMEQAVYGDAVEIIRTFFTDTVNVDHLYLRFTKMNGDTPTLVLAVKSSREEDLIRELSRLNQTKEEAQQFLERHARLVYGTGWRN